MTTKNLIVLFTLLAILLTAFHIYYKLVDIASASTGVVKAHPISPIAIEKEKALRQELKQENDSLRNKLEEATILLSRLEKKEKYCDDLQLKYNQIYLIINN
jgi:hypothetical protein